VSGIILDQSDLFILTSTFTVAFLYFDGGHLNLGWGSDVRGGVNGNFEVLVGEYQNLRNH
jgi:hypothetical protein